MFGMEIAEHAMEMRGSLESLFMLGTVGDMIGVPILPPYYSLRYYLTSFPRLQLGSGVFCGNASSVMNMIIT